MRKFVFTDAKSNKFWHVDLQGTSFTVTFGRVGTAGQTQQKSFPTADAALKAYDKVVAEKLGKGYTETTGGTAPAAAATPLAKSLEQALVENPDDVAAHSAYADYLMEQGDTRGEFVQVQLALKDPRQPEKEREKLRQREAELLRSYAKRWMGDVGRFLFGKWSGPDKPFHYAFARGWLDHVRVLPFPTSVLAALAKVPEARLLRQLEIVYDMRYHPFDFEKVIAGPAKAVRQDEAEDEGVDPEEIIIEEPLGLMPVVLKSPYLTNLRAFRLGFSDTGDPLTHSTMISAFEDTTAKQVVQLLEKNPRLEELYLNTNTTKPEALFADPGLGNLRVLQYYYGTERYGSKPGAACPLAALAKNASLKKLTTLRLHPGRDASIDLKQFAALVRSPNLPALRHLQVHMSTLGPKMYEHVVESGILKRLETLDLGYGAMTDESALVLAACPDLKKLKSLDVSRNALTDSGIAALRATGVQVVADNQHEAGNDEYLFEVDVE